MSSIPDMIKKAIKDIKYEDYVVIVKDGCYHLISYKDFIKNVSMGGADVYLKDQIDQMFSSVSTKVNGNTNEISQIKYLLHSDDVNLDQLQEIVNYIKQNRNELDALSIDSVIQLRQYLNTIDANVDKKLNKPTSSTSNTSVFSDLVAVDSNGNTIRYPAINLVTTHQLDDKLATLQTSAYIGEKSPSTINKEGSFYFTALSAGNYIVNGVTITVTASDIDDNAEVQIVVTDSVPRKKLITKANVVVDQAFNPDSVNPIATKEIAKRYDGVLDALSSFLISETGEVELDKTFKLTVGGGSVYSTEKIDNSLLRYNNTQFGYVESGAAFFIWKDVPLVQNGKKITRIVAKMMPPSNAGGNVQNVGMLGIKDGIITVLISHNQPTPPTSPINYDIDVSKYDHISFAMYVLESNPATLTQELQFYTIKGGISENDSVKKFIEKKLEVLDSFVNPMETVWQNVTMPQPNEKANAIINTLWQQFSAAGTANGVINLSNIPDDFDILEITGNFNEKGSGILWFAGFNDSTGVYEQLLKGVAGTGTKTFKIDRTKYEGYVYSRVVGDHKFRIGKTVKLDKKKDSVKEYIDNHISSGSAISNEKSAQIKRPSKVLRLEFTTTDTIPVDKTTTASGTLVITDMEGLGIKKFATMKVQGSSSAVYPKKNWTFALFNDVEKTDSFKLRVGNWAEHSEFVFKSNWIDATHSRNLISNHIWEDIVQSRTYYPKRENEIAYSESYTGLDGRFDSGALCHVDGVPAELYINGNFYGIGNYNIGKKRENYDLKSGNQNHIQIAAETHADFYNYNAAQWEIRNPKTPDANFITKINAWFASNALTGQAFKDAFETNHDLKNAIDFYLLAEFIQSPDMYTKNLLLTSWDSVKYYFLPYDMDTTFGLDWDGQAFIGHTLSIRKAHFWNKFYLAYETEIKARYAELKANDVLTFNNFYRHADNINKMFGAELYAKDQAMWPTIPSNRTIRTSFPQMYDWMKSRITWLDSQYGV